MKKLISILLVLVMVVAFSTTAFANYQYFDDESNLKWYDGGATAEIKSVENESNTATLDVYYNITGGVNSITSPVYCVKIDWSYLLPSVSLDTVNYTWDTENHKYVANESPTSELSGDEFDVNISFRNLSNVKVKANCTWAKNTDSYFDVTKEHDKDGESTAFETLILNSACYDEGSNPKYASALIDTAKTAARTDGKLVFRTDVTPEELTYDANANSNYSYDGYWDRTIKVSLKTGDGAPTYSSLTDWSKMKIGTYTVTLSAPTPEESSD